MLMLKWNLEASSEEDAFLLKGHVPIHEWLAIVTLSFLLILYASYSYFYEPPVLVIEENLPYVTVYLEGGVVSPGFFTAKCDTTLGELLSEIRCKEGVQWERLSLDRVLVDQEQIYVPYKKNMDKKTK